MGMGRDNDGQNCQDGDGPGWTIFVRMERIVGMGMGWDGWGWKGLPGWGWVGLDRIAGMGIGDDRSGWGWVGIGRDGDWQVEFLGWGLAGMDRIGIMGMDGDRLEWGWAGMMMNRICQDGQDFRDGDGLA